MEVMLLAVLSPIVKCEWNLSTWQQALITSVSELIHVNDTNIRPGFSNCSSLVLFVYINRLYLLDSSLED